MQPDTEKKVNSKMDGYDPRFYMRYFLMYDYPLICVRAVIVTINGRNVSVTTK